MTKTRDLTLEFKSVYHILFVYIPDEENVLGLLPKEVTKIPICVLLILCKSVFFQKQGVTHVAAVLFTKNMLQHFPSHSNSFWGFFS